MKNTFRLFAFLSIFSGLLLSSCKDDEEITPTTSDEGSLTLELSGLEDLGDGYAYEGWIIVDGAPVTTGTFTVDENGNPSKSTFTVSKSDIDAASTFVLTIEPMPDNDPAPSDVHILAGDFSGDDANLSIAHMAALNNDFSSSKGKYILATPTDTVSSNEDSGVWFLDNSSGMPAAGLVLPILPAGWAYEGWAVIDGKPVSTGTFTELDKADMAAPFSGAEMAPPFPGEDFLMNAPMGLTFPTSLKGATAVISIEPVPDNSTTPFTLKPLVGMISETADVHTAYDMNTNLAFPTGMAKR